MNILHSEYLLVYSLRYFQVFGVNFLWSFCRTF